jgi:excisionase family DNA binding protein
MESREVMNIREAAGYLGISADTLYKYVSEEKIPAFKLGNRWKFKKTILDAWMERQSMNANGNGNNGNSNGNGKKKSRSARALAAGE